MDLFTEKLEEKKNVDQIIKSNVPEPIDMNQVAEKLITENFEKGLVSEEVFVQSMNILGLSDKAADIIEKGGEGSKGGKVIGHTKSGKPIYDKPEHKAHTDFTEEDHRDAAKVHLHSAYDMDLPTRKRNQHGDRLAAHQTLANKIKESSKK
jgi:hypothetical protein